jgi:hypothetical protein
MTFEITFIDSRWLVNNKRLEDLNLDEKNALNNFFQEMKVLFEEESPITENPNFKKFSLYDESKGVIATDHTGLQEQIKN